MDGVGAWKVVLARCGKARATRPGRSTYRVRRLLALRVLLNLEFRKARRERLAPPAKRRPPGLGLLDETRLALLVGVDARE
jgi:hypothetical protein